MTSVSVDLSGGRTEVVEVPSYRGVEMPFGHIWKIVDGAKVETVGGASRLMVSREKERFGDSGSYEEVSAMYGGSGFISSIAMGDSGEIVPLSVGAGSTTYFCDKTSGFSRGVGRLMFGGNSSWGGDCGMLCMYEAGDGSPEPNYTGTRLCYLP